MGVFIGLKYAVEVSRFYMVVIFTTTDNKPLTALHVHDLVQEVRAVHRYAIWVVWYLHEQEQHIVSLLCLEGYPALVVNA